MIDSFTGEHRFLSNFYACRVRMDDGIRYPTSEHAYQAAKTFDMDWRHKIADEVSPSVAKRYGRSVPLRTDWEFVKVDVMANVLAVKFREGTPMATALLGTKRHMLIEGNTWGDRFWGQVDGDGLNWLGRLLMLQRAILRAR